MAHSLGKRIDQIMTGEYREILKQENAGNLFGEEEINEKQIELLAQVIVILDKVIYFLKKRVAELEEKLKGVEKCLSIQKFLAAVLATEIILH